ncbi:MAG: transposase, partial [Deinococcus-Thermus bacterium]|nr:transposase [Deinococcota bacterium]
AEREGRDYHPRGDAKDAVPKGSDQINFTDPESRIMTSDGAFVQAYNAQAAVDTASHIVLAAQLGNQAPDSEYFPSLVNETIETTGRIPTYVTADAGYYGRSNIEHAETRGAEPLIPPDKIRRNEWRAQQAPKGRIPKNLSRKDRMRRRLATKQGKRLYLQRQASVEPVFGTTKAARGLQQFLHRGLEKNRHLFRFDMAVHNLLKIVRHAQRSLAPLPPNRRPGAATTSFQASLAGTQ